MQNIAVSISERHSMADAEKASSDIYAALKDVPGVVGCYVESSGGRPINFYIVYDGELSQEIEKRVKFAASRAYLTCKKRPQKMKVRLSEKLDAAKSQKQRDRVLLDYLAKRFGASIVEGND